MASWCCGESSVTGCRPFAVVLTTMRHTPAAAHLIHGSNADQGRFLEDFCNWQLIPEFRDCVLNSDIGEIAAGLMGSRSVQFFHDHYLHKDAGTETATPWH